MKGEKSRFESKTTQANFRYIALPGTTAGNASEAILGVRDRIAGCLRSAKESLGDAQYFAIKETKHVAKSADAYVRDNTWAAIGIAAGVGFVLGAISARSHSHRD